jgi:hypothetical protein
MIAIALISMSATVEAQDAAWEIRYALPPDQKPEWTEAGYLPEWTVSFTDETRPTVEISGDTEGKYRGYVILGRRYRVPDPLPRGLHVHFRFQTYCEISRPDMQRSGYVAFGAFTPTGFDAFAADPAQAEPIDLRQAPGLLDLQQIQFSGEDVTEWEPWRSANLSTRLREHAGEDVVLAMIWGGYHYADEEWGKFDDWEMETVSRDEWQKQLFEALDLERPELTAVREAFGAGDISTARRALVEHMKTRTSPPGPELSTTARSAVIAQADEVCEHIFRLGGCPAHKLGDPIQWNEDPFNYDQWAIALNRHSHWLTLGRAYAGTGDEKYAREFAGQLVGWIDAMPVHIGPHWVEGPYFEGGKSPLTLDGGIRMGQTWFPAYYYFRNSPSFDVDAQIAMLRSFYDHALYLMGEAYYHETSNWGTMEANGLLHIGLMLPEFRDAPMWAETAAQRLHNQLTAQVYPDGAQIELTPGYHGVTLGNMLGALELSRRVGYETPEGFEAGLERMFEYYVRIAMPDGRTPAVNDSGWGGVAGMLANGHRLFPHRADFQYLATGGAEGQPPEYTSCALPYAGWYMMRSGWGPDDNYLFFEAGPYGKGHQHEDKLNIILHANGQTILTEPGTYSYDTSDWRRYVLSTRAHNTVLVDGMEQNRRAARETYVGEGPVGNPWVAGDDFDYVEGTYADGYGGENDRTVTHTRKLLFVRPDYWICVDHFTPTDDRAHVYEALFHLDAQSVEKDNDRLSVVTRSEDAALAIVPLQVAGLSLEIIEGQTEPVVQGWLPTGRHNELRPIPTLVYRKEAAGETAMAYALIPFEGRESPLASVETPDVPQGVLAATLRWGDGSVHRFAHNPGGASLTVGPVNTHAPVAFVSSATDGGVQRIFEYQR